MSESETDLSIFEATARDAAQAAGAVLRERYGSTIRVEQKGLHDYVTQVDRDAEDAALSLIRQRFPDHAILAEESGATAGDTPGGPRWIVDPLDGTTNFIHRVPTFCVSVGLEDSDGLAVGAIYDPMRDELFHGHRGGGAFLNGVQIRCSQPAGLGDSLLATGFPFRELSRLEAYLKTFEAFVRSTAGIRRAGSAAIDLAYVACGRYDGFWEVGLSAWDVAAGLVLVREAGGLTTNVVGGDVQLDRCDVVAAGPELHAAVLDVTQPAFG